MMIIEVPDRFSSPSLQEAIMATGKETGFKITHDEIRSISEQMKALPHARDAAITTKRDALVSLTPAIKEMQDKGYTIAVIAEWLARHTQIKVSTATLREAIKPRRRNVKTPIRQSKEKPDAPPAPQPQITLLDPRPSRSKPDTATLPLDGL